MHTAIRMVNKPLETLSSIHFYGLIYSHLKSLNGQSCTQCISKYPSYDFTRIRIRYQMKVRNIPICQLNISNIAHPQLISRSKNNIFYLILPFVITVV